MYAPATPAPPAVALAPVGITTSALLPLDGLPAPAHTALSIRHADLNVLDGHPATIAGTLTADPRSVRLADRVVSLQVRRRHGWTTVARTHTGARGRYLLRYTLHHLGSELVRVRFAQDAQDRGSHRRAGRLNVYRLAGASWYAAPPTGGSLACGGWLTSSTVGVANKTLPCGTLVTLRYDGHTVRVPVIDRGPYVAGRDFDLTEATKRALGFEGTGEVWATS
jgi:rare lipoprotein A